MKNQAKKDALLARRIVKAVRKTFLDNPDKTVSKLAITLFASILSKKEWDLSVSPEKRKRILEDALQILLKSKK